jgi:Abnormal spindle-like microcephaly-assoc'd, ASPM-SPD-2-Hydin
MNKLILIAAALALPVFSQTPLQVVVSGNATVSSLPPGGAVTLTATDIGQPATVTVTATNTSAGTISVTGVSLSGTSEITLLASSFPVSVAPNTSTSFSVQYLPASGNTVTAQVAIGYTAAGQPGSFPISISGIAPRLAYSYSFTGGALTDLNSGDRITFAGTNVGSSASAVVNVLNRGSATAVVQSVAVSGAGFQLSGVRGPFLVPAGQQASFTVIFTPQSSGGNQGLLTVALATSSVSFQLSGAGTAANFTAAYTLADGNAHSLFDGAALTFPSVDIGATGSATIEIQNQGTGTGTVNNIQVSGSAFRLSGAPALPANVGPGQSVRFSIVFAPTQAGTSNGSFRIDLTGRSIAGSLSGATAVSNVSLAYIDPDTNSVLPLRDGATLPFPGTPAGASSSVTLVASNSGAGTGTVDSITVNTASPSTFQLLSLPVFPAAVPPGQQLRFGLRFAPQQAQAYSGSLQVSINGQVITLGIDAHGSGPRYSYTYGSAGATPGGTLSLADTTVGQTTSVTVSISNGGTADGQIAAIGVTGSGFSVSDVPALPATVKTGASQSFTLNFAPTQPGAATGRLTIGSDTFTVTANGIGSRLTYSYTNTAAAVPVTEGGVVIFAPIEVGKNEKLQFSIQNTGTGPTAISSINLATAGTSFAVDQLPALPFNLDAGATATFAVGFTPGSTGGLTATLRINAATFTLSGNGLQPAALPSYQFQTPSAAPQPGQQPAIGLTLAAPYPVALDGTLVLTFVSSVFTDDPAIQFASGGRAVKFTIPANSTQALFNGNPSIPLQTGTTAGTIVITPSFAMQGGFDLTPPSPDPLTIAIPRTAPQLLSATITSPTTTSFTVVLNGFSTTRALTQLDVQITPQPGVNISAAHLTVDVNTAAASWYQSTASQTAGGSFLAAIPFVLQNGSSTDDLVHRLQSLSITATNSAGVSSSVTVPIR